MKYRKATLSDVPDVVRLAVASVSVDPLPVRIDRESMAQTAKECLGPQHFLWVTEHEGRVVAAVAAHVSPGFWFEKMQASVLLYYTEVPGAGLPLLRELARWVKGRPVIKIAVMELEPNVDPRLVAWLKRLGFARESLNLSFVRGI